MEEMKDRELGIFLGCIVGLIAYMFMPYYNDFESIIPYGVLWYFLNPFYANIQLWSYTTTGLYLLVIILQYRFVSRTILLMNMFSALLFRVMNAQQDITVIMFAPLAALNPVFSLLFIFQKLGLGWSWDLSDQHWVRTMAQIHSNVGGFQPIYWLLGFWFLFPLGVWVSNRWLK